MFKKYQKLICAALLVLMLAATALTVVVMAANTAVPTFTVTIEFEGLGKNESYSAIRLEKKGEVLTPKTETETALVYDVAFDFADGELLLCFEPKTNEYDVASFAHDGNTMSGKGGDSLVYDLSGLEQNETYVVTTGYKRYTIDRTRVPADATWVGGVEPPASYDYKQSEPIVLGALSRPGKTFSGWKFYDVSNNQLGEVTKDEASGQYLLEADKFYPFSGNVVYLEPVFRGDPQVIVREDLEFDVENDVGTKTPVRTENGASTLTEFTEEMRTGEDYQANPVTGQMGDPAGAYKVYPGYKPFEADVAKYYSTLTKMSTFAELNHVYRYYVPINYTIVYEGVESCTWATEKPATHRFNASDVIPQPTRAGYVFTGWRVFVGDKEITKDLNPEVAAIRSLTLDAYQFLFTKDNAAEEIRLVATWNYDVVMDIDLSRVDVWFGEQEYTGVAQSFPFGTELKIKIEVTDPEYRLTKIGSTALEEHVTTYEFVYTVQTVNRLSAVVLPMIEEPDYQIDYKNEMLLLPQGSYVVSCNGVVESFEGESLAIANDFFGKTLTLTRLGLNGESANRTISFALTARGPAPTLNCPGCWMNGIATNYDTIEIQLNLANLGDLADGLEYSCMLESTDASEPIVWVSLQRDEAGIVRFENLSYGTYYLLRVRLSATDSTPHGEEYVLRIQTSHQDYIRGEIRKLKQQRTGGEMVDAILNAAIAKLEDFLANGTSISAIQAEVEKLLAEMAEPLALAKVQDAQLDALKALYRQLIASAEFDAAGEAALTAIYDAAVAAIKGVSTSEELATHPERVDEATMLGTEALAAMRSIPIRYLYAGDKAHRLTIGGAGLPQGSKWIVSFAQSYDEWVSALEAAIRTGNLVMDGREIDTDELTALALRAYVTMSLELPEGAVMPDDDCGYTVRLLLPDYLRGRNIGGQAAYYTASGALVLLDSVRDDDYLEFTSHKAGISNVMLLCDEEVDLTGLIWLLSLIALAQLIAIALLLIKRVKRPVAERHYSMVLPVALAVRFLPNNAATVVLILGITVVLLQIVLMVLLCKSDLIGRRKKVVKRYYVEEPIEPAVEEPAFAEDDAIDTTVDDIFADALSDDAPVEDALNLFEDAPETAAAEETPDFEDFIEPAATPAYSLPDEEVDAFATEEVYATEDGYAVEEGYVTEDGYAVEEGYVTEDGYAVEEGYVTEDGYAVEEGYVTEDGYAVEEGYVTEDGYAVEEGYVTEDGYVVEDGYEIPDGEWEYAEADAETDETWVEADATEEWQEGTVWESDELAPEDELLYEEDYATGEPGQTLDDEDVVYGDPNPYEQEDAAEDSRDV